MSIFSKKLIEIQKILFITLIITCTQNVVGVGLEDGGGDTGYTGILGKVRNFLGEIGTVANEVATGINKLSRQVRTVEKFLDAAVDEDCYYECPYGQIAKPKKGHKPIFNGCGSYGIEEYLNGDTLPLSEFVDCCNGHDICYETCGTDRDECDLKFKKCLYGHCRNIKDSTTKLKFKGCQAGAKILYTGTTAVGCKPYLDAQETACVCVPARDEF